MAKPDLCTIALESDGVECPGVQGEWRSQIYAP